MRSLALWLHKYSLPIILLITLVIAAYSIFIRIDNNKLTMQNCELKEQISKLETELDNNKELLFDRNYEIARLRMEANEWKELFYAEIDFQPYEGPEW